MDVEEERNEQTEQFNDGPTIIVQQSPTVL